MLKYRGRSSVGRAPESHSGGREFEPHRLHKKAGIIPAFFCALAVFAQVKTRKILLYAKYLPQIFLAFLAFAFAPKNFRKSYSLGLDISK